MDHLLQKAGDNDNCILWNMTIRTSRHQLRLLLLFQSSLFRTFLTCKCSPSYVLLFCVLAHCLTQGQRTQKSTSMERTQTSTSTRPMMGLHPEEQPPEELQEQVPKRQLMKRNLPKRKLPKRKIPKRKPLLASANALSACWQGICRCK